MDWEFYIAGVQFHRYKEVLDQLEVGQELVMEPDPENKFDPNAVKLLFGDIMLGHVPMKKNQSSEVSAFLSWSEKPVCNITELNKLGKPWEMIKVRIQEADEPDEEFDEGLDPETT